MRLTHPTGRPNFSILHFRGGRVYFSYETVIAVVNGWTNVTTLTVNEWGPTTGKHINYVKREEADVIQTSHSAVLEKLYELYD